ncbi:probable inactive ribonuclease-like protein 13 [Gracilinanus agilis]|uniref:probable inactive ribonuclease-like protein 13 n=1 Tax=Gracilinanus agilis TaxID=191870 RepID=UPI001CFE4E0A|nr:probable inactive ribonuclease-like protein 13 [Gracilinanus agilis]
MVLVRILVLQLLLVPVLAFLSFTSKEVENFRALHIDFPKVQFSKGFQGYCNGLMSYVRGRQSFLKQCPNIHHVLHAPWRKVTINCKKTDSFCEDFNEYCSLSHDPFSITTCTRIKETPPTTCLYNETSSTRRVYLLCSRKNNAKPTYIIGLF